MPGYMPRRSGGVMHGPIERPPDYVDPPEHFRPPRRPDRRRRRGREREGDPPGDPPRNPIPAVDFWK